MRIHVLLPLPLDQAYTYEASSDVPIGSFVEVPWGRKTTWGVVWELDVPSPGPDITVKPVKCVLPVPPLSLDMVAFVNWVATYTLNQRGRLLKMVVPVPKALESSKTQTLYGLTQVLESKSTPTVERLKAFFQTHESPLSLADLSQQTGLRRDVLRRLKTKGILVERGEKSLEASFPKPHLCRKDLILTPQQQDAVEHLKEGLQTQSPQPMVLEGLTGSGKTEVYMEAIQETLDKGRQVVVLLPEIALTAQWLERFEKRFGVGPAVWHADLSPSKRLATWRAILQHQAWVVVGARSALFLPYPDLGLIVVDEEHDASYKQEEGVLYQARDMAVVRGSLGKIPVILSSATPSLETVWNIQQGRYGHVKLDQRYQASLPTLTLVDMRAKGTPKRRWISPPLADHLRLTLGKGEQSLLFLNRRGFAPLMLCGACGFRFTCPDCETFLVVHQQAGRLSCHHCGHHRTYPPHCPGCQKTDSFLTCGPGVEQVEQEVQTLFPQARTAVMSRDTLTSITTTQAMMSAMAAGEIDILIGTQLVVKGHHFPNLTCVGILDGDLSLYGSDPRACERTYQLLHQVSGRAGRADKPGHVFLQTHDPQHPALQALEKGQTQAFVEQELHNRQTHHLPPYTRLAAVIVSGPSPSQVEQVALRLARSIANPPQGVEVLGPVPAPLSRLRGKTRWRLLVKAHKRVALQRFLQHWFLRVRTPPNIRVVVDVDPYTFL